MRSGPVITPAMSGSSGVLAEERAAICGLPLFQLPCILRLQMPQRMMPRSAYPQGVRRGDRSSAEPFARYSAWTCSKAPVSMSGSWTGSWDQIHSPRAFHFSLVAWPSLPKKLSAPRPYAASGPHRWERTDLR